MFSDIRRYTRIAVGLTQSLHAPVPERPEELLRDQFRNREKTFLDTLRQAVFADPQHPYSVMFGLAGCEFGDLANLVARNGLESTLERLRDAGVYLAHDEWKGRQPIVRAGREIPGGTNSFRNHRVKGWLDSTSSGSRGRPVVTARSTAMQYHALAYRALRYQEFDLSNRLQVAVRPMLPSSGGIEMALRARRTGAPLDRWFCVEGASKDRAYRALTSFYITLGNLQGARAIYPQYLPPNDHSPVARHIALRRREGHAVFVQGMASALVRIACAAVEDGWDISGTLFLCGGEALTPGKLKLFESAGCEAFSSYTLSEIGHAGFSCRQMRGSCVHLFEDALAFITHRRPAPYSDDVDVNSIHFTTLLPYAPNIFVNLEIEDDGVIEPAACDCVFSRNGFHRRLNHISSFGKMTPQGMTFAGTDLVGVLEVELPARLGGHPGHYQLVECESENQQTGLRLHVSPRAGVGDTGLVRETFLSLMRSRWGGILATRTWKHSEALEVVIAEPYVTRTGKVHAIRLLGAHSKPQPSREVTHAT